MDACLVEPVLATLLQIRTLDCLQALRPLAEEQVGFGFHLLDALRHVRGSLAGILDSFGEVFEQLARVVGATFHDGVVVVHRLADLDRSGLEVLFHLLRSLDEAIRLFVPLLGVGARGEHKRERSNRDSLFHPAPLVLWCLARAYHLQSNPRGQPIGSEGVATSLTVVPPVRERWRLDFSRSLEPGRAIHYR